MDLIMESPPAASAGKNFTTSRPSSIATSTSLGLEHPGVTGIPFQHSILQLLDLNQGLR